MAAQRTDPLCLPARPRPSWGAAESSEPTEFCRTQLRGGAERVIAGLHRPGRDPAVAILQKVAGTITSRIFIFADRHHAVVRALDFARAGQVGVSPREELSGPESPIAIRVWCSIGADDHRALVHFGRVRRAFGERLGLTVLSSAQELEALARACAWLSGH